MGTRARKDREKEVRSNDIVIIATEMFVEKGYFGTSMDAIASRAELSKGTLYLYFRNKMELYFAVGSRMNRFYNEFLKERLAEEKTGLAKLRRIPDILGEFYRLHSKIMDFLGENTAIVVQEPAARVGERYLECVREEEQTFMTVMRCIEEGKADGSITATADVPKLTLYLAIVFHGLREALFSRNNPFDSGHLSPFGFTSGEFLEFVLEMITVPISFRSDEFIQRSTR